jgi:hypothetical protein
MANDDAVSVFESVRPRLFGIAYRMLGSASEAEDIVQDTWLRWQGTESQPRHGSASVSGDGDHATGNHFCAIRTIATRNLYWAVAT